MSSSAEVATSPSKEVAPNKEDQEKSTNLPRLLYFGEVPVESSFHGSALLHRLLRGYPVEKLHILERRSQTSKRELRLPGVSYQSVPAAWTIGGRVIRARFPILYWPIWNILGRLWARRAGKRLDGFRPEAILTVHEGSLWLGAYFLARRLKVPLHLIVHDDCFRDIPQNAWLRRHLESRFGRIYRSAVSRFSVSPYMEELFYQRYGPRGDVLYPSRSAEMTECDAPPVRSDKCDRPFTVAYGGSAIDGGYLQALKLMAEVLLSRGGRLLLFGPFSREDVIARGLDSPNVTCGGMLNSSVLIARFREETDALFVPMSFDPSLQLNMTISFPSKLADYTAAGLPIIIFGPPYSSAAKWARSNCDCSESVDQFDRDLLEAAISRLEGDPSYRYRLGANALRAGKRFFAHGLAESTFFRRISMPSLASTSNLSESCATGVK